MNKTCGNCVHAEVWQGEYYCIFTDAVICEDTEACEMWHLRKGEEND